MKTKTFCDLIEKATIECYGEANGSQFDTVPYLDDGQPDKPKYCLGLFVNDIVHMASVAAQAMLARWAGVPARIGFGHRLVPVAQPVLHQGDLVALRVDEPARERADRRARAVAFRPPRHGDRLGVMADHSRDEMNISRRVGTTRAVRTGAGRRRDVRLRLTDGLDRRRRIRRRRASARARRHDD